MGGFCEKNRGGELKFIVFLFFFFFFYVVSSQNIFFEKVYGKEFNPITSIHGIAKDSLGYIWFASWNGAYRYDGKTFDLYYHNSKDATSIPNNRIRNVISDVDLGLWFLTFDWKYTKYNYQLNQFEVVEDRLVEERIKTKLSSYPNKLNRDKIINGNRYYLSSHSLISENVNTGEITQYFADINQPGKLFDDYITTFFIDDENIIWLGTRNGDIYMVNPNRNPFNLHYTYRPGLKKTKLTTVRAILKNDDKVWLGTDEGVLIYSDNDELDIDHPFYKSKSEINFVRTLFRDKNGGIWIGGVKGLEYYNPKTNKIVTLISKELCPEIPIYSIFSIESYGKNSLWIGLYNGIARINLKDNSLDLYSFPEAIDGHSVTDMLFLDDYKLLLATEGNGIVCLKSDKKLEVADSIYPFKSGFNNKRLGNIIYALHKDKEENLWVGASDRLSKIKLDSDTLEIERIRLQYDSPSSYISSITDDNENLWVAHKEGVTVINIKTGEISNFQKQDQFSSWSFWERAFFKDTITNTIYFGAKNGYVSFSPEKIKTISKKYNKVVLKSLFLSNEEIQPFDLVLGKPVLLKSISQTKFIKLDHENGNFSIAFTSFNYNNASKEIFEYKLEGYDDEWVKTMGNKLTFNKVSPGKYTFRIRLATANPEENQSSTDLEIYIASPWYQTGVAKAFFIMLFGITIYWVFKGVLYRDRLKNEIKLERINRKQQAELNKEKLEFFTSVSHELKTPLTLISDPLKQLQSGALNEKNKEVYLSIVNRNVQHLTRLINQILDFRKSEKGKLKAHSTSCNFNELVQGCYHSFKPVALKREIEFNFEIEEAPIYCYIDVKKTEQVMMNLLSNAFKYTPNGGKVLLLVGFNSDKTQIKIIIKDTGVGIDTKSLKKIFKPFNNIGSRPFHGNSSGIGLSLTKNIIQILGGKIKLNSVPNKGTKVSVKLPYVKGNGGDISGSIIKESELIKSLEKYQTKKAEKEASKPTILLVEDNYDVQTYLKNELSKDYTILQAYDGKKGLDSAIEHIPDLIVSDVMMPIMEGVDMCKYLKLNESTCHIPVILLTAKDSDENQIEGYNFGAEAYITKPFSVDVLIAQIKSVLENRMLLQKQLAKVKSISKLQKEAPDLDTIFLKKLADFVKDGIQDTRFNTEKLAQLMGISQSQLYRKLKAVSGSTVHEYIIRVKMDYAENLLKNSNLNVSEIAYKTGFTEPSNFSRTFSKYYGCSPLNYLKKSK